MYYSTWTFPKKKLGVSSYLLQVKVMLTAHSKHSPMSKFEFLFSHIHNLLAKHLITEFSVEAPDLYMLFTELGRLNLAHSFVTAVCLEAESDPRVNINMAFLGQQLHYWVPAWWTTPLLLWRYRGQTRESGGETERREEVGYRISRMMKRGAGECGSVSEGCLHGDGRRKEVTK